MKYLPLLALLLVWACNHDSPSRPADHELAGAVWLEGGRPLPTEDSLFYRNHPAPLFRKEFQTHKPIESAELIITAAGYYLASINATAVSNDVLDPAWTDYSKRIYYSTYDVTNHLRDGNNCLGVSLGNGFYNPLPLRKWGRRNLRADTQVGKPTFIAKLRIRYRDGETQEIVSDSTWKQTTGPLTKNSVYIGVTYDAREEKDGWDQPGYDDTSWDLAKPAKAPTKNLQKAFFPPVQITREIPSKAIYATGTNQWIVDMGENFTGTYRARFRGGRGDTVTLRFGERIYDDGSLNPMTSVIGQIKRPGVGGPGAPDIAWQTDSFILGEEDTWYQPDFTYHVYRYIEVNGLTTAPETTDIFGLSIHTQVGSHGDFSSSSQLLNDIQKATRRTFLANLVSVQSDCPAREKFGYGGDINATSESFIYNFDMQAFYRKTIYDWLDAMNDSSFVDTAPYVGIQYCGISWESAYLMTQYYLYLHYGDTEIVHELYEQNVRWMEKVARLHPEGLINQGLSDHESLQPVPVQLTGTAHYLQCARIMEAFANVVGNETHRIHYQKLADNLKDRLRAEFWDQPVDGPINKQTLFATLLYHDIVPASEIGAAADSLRLAVSAGPAGHFNTGIFGTKYALEALSQHVSPQQAFEIVNSRQYPGWGHMIDRGATTLWETWKESDNVYSNNHPMFGSVTEWFYRWLGGIRPDPAHPGFREFVLKPNIPRGLDAIHCEYSSPLGLIESSWSVEPNGTRRYVMKVPKGSMANVTLPITPDRRIAIRKDGLNLDGLDGLQTGQFDLEEGAYEISVSN